MSLARLSLSYNTIRSLHEGGIRTLEDVVRLTPDELRQFHGIKTTAEAIHALARALLTEQAVCFKPLATECRQAGWFFDIETVPYTDSVWSIGWSAGDNHTHVAIVAPLRHTHSMALRHDVTVHLVEDSEEAWRAFARHVSQNKQPIFHWTGFDAGVMKKRAPRDAQELLAGRLLDLHRYFKQSIRFPLASLSLKPTAAFLGFQWSAYDDWEQAWQDYGRWVRTNTVDYLVQACTYQRDDVIAMEVVHRWMQANALDTD